MISSLRKGGIGLAILPGYCPNGLPLNGKRAVAMKFATVLAVNFILWSTEKLHGIPLPVAAVLGCALFSFPTVDLLVWERDKCRIGCGHLYVTKSTKRIFPHSGYNRIFYLI